MKALFHYAYDVNLENGKYRPSRFTERQVEALKKLNEDFGQSARCGSGIAMCFYTSSQEISFSFGVLTKLKFQCGFDIWENGVFYSHIPVSDVVGEDVFTYTKKTAGETLIEIYLPAAAEMEIWDLNLGDFRFLPLKPKTVLFYGDSLTQCLYTPNSSLAFPAVLSRIKGVEHLNRGIGSLYYEASCLDENDKFNPDTIIVEFGPNDIVKHDSDGKVVLADGEAVFCTVDDVPELMAKAEAYLDKLCRIYPNAELNIITSISVAKDFGESVYKVREAYNTALTQLCGKKQWKCIDADKIISSNEQFRTEDKIHFNQLGSASVAIALDKYII